MEGQSREREITRQHSQACAESGSCTKIMEACGECPNCGAVLGRDDYEICPVCGGKLVDYCTFCGAQMSPSDIDCPECGMPADGIICPDCNTRNFRTFCRVCGKPLSLAARKAVEKAKADPKVREAANLMVRLSELQAELDGESVDEENEVPAEPTEGELRLRELMAKVGFTAAEAPKPAGRRFRRSREEIQKEYQKAVEEANRILEEMLPPAGMTPQQQRSYYTARKVAMTEIIEERHYKVKVLKTMGWECNECHILHNNPSECGVREFGGKWITCSEYQDADENTPGAEVFVNRKEKKVYKRG